MGPYKALKLKETENSHGWRKRRLPWLGVFSEPIENCHGTAFTEIPLTSSLYIDGHMTETPGKPRVLSYWSQWEWQCQVKWSMLCIGSTTWIYACYICIYISWVHLPPRMQSLVTIRFFLTCLVANPCKLHLTGILGGLRIQYVHLAHLRWSPYSLSPFEFSGILHVTH